MVHIRRCPGCQKYTFQEQHCTIATILPRPPKFSLQDKYESYRRDVKKKELREKSLY